MKVQVFAVLKDYFDKEFEVNEPVQDTTALKEKLSSAKPEATNLLNICRFAVNDEFIDNQYQFNNDDVICIIPPASGG